MHALVLIDMFAYFCCFPIAYLRLVPFCSYSSLCFYLLALGFWSFALLHAPLCYPHCFPLFSWCFPPIFLRLSSGSPTACLLSSCGFPLIFLRLSHGVPVACLSFSCAFLFACLLLSYGFLLVFLLFSYGVPVPLLCFPVSFLRFPPSIVHRKLDQQFTILGCLEALFWLFLVSWGLLGPKLVPKVFWRKSWNAFWVDFGLHLGALGPTFFDIFGWKFQVKKGSASKPICWWVLVQCWFNFGLLFWHLFDHAGILQIELPL